MEITVVICSHNPRQEFLENTLEGLKSQTCDKARWQLLVIDNASTPALDERFDLSWHGNARFIVEKELGLTPARIRGFRETEADLVLMVDDDNVLAPDFLEKTLQIASEFPTLGAWGASISGDFEHEVPPWLQRELLYLAIRPIQSRQIAPSFTKGFPTPAGAGMTVRRLVFERYVHLIQHDTIRRTLDRRGSSLVSAGDTDLSICAWDLELGLGNFPELKLKHLIPEGRMTVAYMARLHESMAYSENILKYLRNENHKVSKPPVGRYWKTVLREILRWRLKQLKFFLAQQKGFKTAEKQLQQLRKQA